MAVKESLTQKYNLAIGTCVQAVAIGYRKYKIGKPVVLLPIAHRQ
jgi:hypothetical protein